MKQLIVVLMVVALGGCAPNFQSQRQRWRTSTVTDVKPDQGAGSAWVTIQSVETDVVTMRGATGVGGQVITNRSVLEHKRTSFWLCSMQAGGAPLCQKARWGLRKGETAKPAAPASATGTLE